MIVVGLIPAVALFVISLLGALISVRWASIGYAAAIYFLLIIIVLSCLCVRAPNDPGRRAILTDEEERLFKKHYAFFLLPMGTQNFVHFLNFARMFGIVWILICFWQGLYWTAGSLAVFYAISSLVMVWLMPIAHYKEAAEKGHEFARRNLAMIDHILQNRDFLKF